MRKAVGIIPARWASTRFQGKPLYLIAGKPLLRHVWERCLRARKLDLVIVATDDMRIANAAFDWGAEVALTSPNHQSGTDRIAEVVRKAKEFAFIMNIQGDEPLLRPEHIDALLGPFGRTDAEVTTLSTPCTPQEINDPNAVKVVTATDGRALYFSRATIPYQRGAPLTPRKHIGIYAYRKAALRRFAELPPRMKATVRFDVTSDASMPTAMSAAPASQ